MNNNLIRNINTILLGKHFDIPEERIITGVVVYKTLEKILTIRKDLLSDLSSTIDSYIGTFMSTVSEMRNTYVSYSVMLYKVKTEKITSMSQLNDDIIEYIYSLYLDKTKIVSFSSDSYSCYMYSIDDLSKSEDDILRNIHFSIMVPLVSYYKNLSGINDNDVKIFSALVTANLPGKAILFSINNIGNINIINDIRKPSIGIRDKVYNASVNDDKVLLIVK